MMITRKTNGKFVLEFDKVPAFVYVCEEPRKEGIIINGEKIAGWRELELKTSMVEVPEYTLKAVPVRK